MRCGFSILEVLIVLSGVVIVITYSLFLYETCITAVRTTYTHTNESVQLYRALYLMMHDIYRASDMQKSSWIFKNQETIWPVIDGHCGYHIKDGQLIRSSGIYSVIHAVWYQRTQSLVARLVKDIRIIPDIRSNIVQGVTILLKGNYQELSLYCACGTVCLSL